MTPTSSSCLAFSQSSMATETSVISGGASRPVRAAATNMLASCPIAAFAASVVGPSSGAT